MSRKALAALVGVSADSIFNWEMGVYSPRPAVRLKLEQWIAGADT